MRRILTTDPHPGCNKLPEEFRDREIVSIVREPFSWYVSLYEYRGHTLEPYQEKAIQNMPEEKNRLCAKYPNFPYMTFPEYLHFQCDHYNKTRMISGNIYPPVGQLSFEFIRMYFQEPEKLYAMTETELRAYVDSKKYTEDMYPVTFLRTDRLNSDMHIFLKKRMRTIDPQLLDIILYTGKINQSKKRSQTYWTDELRNFVREKEYFYFEIFSHLHYETAFAPPPTLA